MEQSGRCPAAFWASPFLLFYFPHFYFVCLARENLIEETFKVAASCERELAKRQSGWAWLQNAFRPGQQFVYV